MLPPGSWPSPLSADDVARAGVSYGQVAVTDAGATVWWSEGRPAEGGRTTVLRRVGDGPVEEVLPARLDARTRVHEYGGACWAVVGEGLVTCDLHDQRLWSVTGQSAAPLTPETGLADRYGEPVLVPGGRFVICVREVTGAARVRHELVAVPLDGSAADDRDAVVVLWAGSDFVSSPRLSPDGGWLAFLTWEHPNMPWDGTTLRRAPLRTGPSLEPALGAVEVVLGGDGNAVQQPVWCPDGSLWCVAEVGDWWNVVRSDGSPVWQVEQECGWPLWQIGMSSVAALPDGRVAVLSGRGARSLSLLAPDGAATAVELPFTTWRPWVAVDGTTLVAVASSPTTLGCVVAVDLSTGAWREVAGPQQPDPAWCPEPEELTVPSAGGRVTYAYLYPPTSPFATAEGLPPYVLWVHGGPTSQVPPHYDDEIAYFTSRGIGIVDVNYGGSTGYGRAYRDTLRGQWGVVDVEDCEAVARWLLAEGRASAVGIRGGSAGGWTVLAALTRGGSVFATGASYFGVVDLLPFAETTHDFESRYLDALIGPLPAARQLYVDRSPLSHVDTLDRPLLVLQGLDDPVVPPAQAELLVEALRSKGIAHAYLPFAGEAHGFRKAENVAAAIEAELSFYGQVLGFDPPGVPVVPMS